MIDEAFSRLSRDFFMREEVVQISKELLGKFLVTHINGHYCSGKIVETEAYRAPDDKACHAHNNRFTNRTRVMFGTAGFSYVYLCYGVHHLFNIVTAPEGMAHAVLIRAIEPVDNVGQMMERRGFTSIRPQLSAGPGVMTKAMGITTDYNEVDLCQPDSPIWIESRGKNIEPEEIVASPRVGVGYAEECALWDWRFRIKENPWTSRAK